MHWKLENYCWEKLKKTNKWRDHVHGLGDSTIKMIVLPSAIPSKIPVDFFVEIDKLILKFIWKIRGTRIVKYFWKRMKFRRPILLDFRASYEATIIEALW